MKHQTRLCINPDCTLRFTIPLSENISIRCPRCGSGTIPIDEGYDSNLIPQRKQDESGLPTVVAVLDNIRSALNVGAILRTADGAGIRKIFLCGITPTPENPKVLKTSLGAENAIRWEHSWNILEIVGQLKSEGFLILCLEGGKRSINLFQNIGKILSGQPVALFIGNEINGIDPVVLEKADFSVFLPMQGEKESLNVATAFGIAAYLLRYGKTIK